MNKTVVYTAIFGEYDRLSDPVVYGKDIDYICFTDCLNFKQSNIWQVKLIRRFIYQDSVRSARLIKICPHRFLPEYDYSLWIDGNIEIQNIPDVKEMLHGKTIALPKHPQRNCIYAEGEVCQKIPKDNREVIEGQLKTYKKNNYPKNAGLYATGIIARKHGNRELISLSEEWWRHIGIFSLRDQISFPVVFRGYPIEHLPKEILNVWAKSENPFAVLKDHSRK